MQLGRQSRDPANQKARCGAALDHAIDLSNRAIALALLLIATAGEMRLRSLEQNPACAGRPVPRARCIESFEPDRSTRSTCCRQSNDAFMQGEEMLREEDGAEGERDE